MQFQFISATQGSHSSREIQKMLSKFWTENRVFSWDYFPWKLSDLNEKKIKQANKRTKTNIISVHRLKILQDKNYKNYCRKTTNTVSLFPAEYSAQKIKFSGKVKKNIFPTVLISWSLLLCPSEGLSKYQVAFSFSDISFFIDL